LGFFERLRARFRRKADLFNLQIEPAYAIKASARSPYFQALERAARSAGYLGTFIVDETGSLRPGCNEALQTRRARLVLDVYPNPAAIEGRTVADYDNPASPRRTPRATLLLDDDSELSLWLRAAALRIDGPAMGLDERPPGGSAGGEAC
jgi:hypothetical protein